MPTAYIANIALELPVRFITGQVLDVTEADILNREYMKRLIAQVRYRYDHNELNDDSIHAGAFTMGINFVFNEANAKETEDDENDPVFIEGMKIAREMIIKELADSGLTEIPNIDNHARALFDGSEAIRIRARQRCETRWRMAKEALGVTG